MLKKTVTFTDYNGVERTEDHYFNMTKAELTMLDLSTPGGIVKKLTEIGQKMDVPAIMETFRSFILNSYGEVSSDGRRFIKSQQLKDEFEQTEAYSQIFMELCTDAQAAADFLAAIVPSDIGAELKKQTPSILPVPET